MLPRSVRAQVTVGAALVVMVVVALAGLAIALRIDHRDGLEVDRQLTVRAERLRADAARLFSNRDVGVHPGTQDRAANNDFIGLLEGSQSLVRLISAGQVIAALGEQPRTAVPVPATAGYSTLVLGDESWRSLVVPLGGDDSLQVLQSLEPVAQRFDATRRVVAVVAVLATLVTALGVAVITGLVLQPLQRLRRAALRIRPHDLDQRLPVASRPKEVAELSATVNAMLKRLQTSISATRRFTADAGHELRNPLTGLGVDLESLLRNPELPAPQRQEMLAAMAVEHRRMVARLEGLQTLARGDTGSLPLVTPVDLTELVDDAVRRARRRSPETTYRFVDQPSATVLVDGWPAGLQLAVDNLLENATLHGRPGGTVDVVLAHGDADARVIVTDDGPGIAADRRDAMKQRFTRGDRTRSDGSGLGLALVEQQAELHGGNLHLGQAARGGLAATLAVPVARSGRSPHATASDER